MSHSHDFVKGYKALVIGACGTIGKAFCEALSNDVHCRSVTRLSRRLNAAFDLELPQAFPDIVETLASSGPFDLVIDATGALVIDGQGPEKTLRALDPVQCDRYFRINATGPMLLLKVLEPYFASGSPCYAKLSARVGSISDNRLGGWYGYRASKAALNMMLKTAAIELQRKRPGMRVIALQPGTVFSPLSSPFIHDRHEVLDARIAVQGLMRAIMSMPDGPGAHFLDYQSRVIPW